MSSNEVLEVHVATIRRDVDELKEDFRAAVLRIDASIRASESTLRAEINAMAAKATKDIEALAARMDAQFAEVRQDIRELRADNKAMREDLQEVRKQAEKTREEVHKIGSKLNALFLLIGALCTGATLFLTFGDKLHWFARTAEPPMPAVSATAPPAASSSGSALDR